MAEMPFEQSLTSGPHRWLNALVGVWQGTSRIWFGPGNLHDESPVQGQISPVLGGRFMRHEYQGSVKGKPQTGLAIFGISLAPGGEQECAWADSWHMSTGLLFSKGKPSPDAFNVLGHYAAGTESWGWRTTIAHPAQDLIEIRMFNISPAGEEDLAVEVDYRRV